MREKDIEEIVRLIYKYGNEGQVTVHPKIPGKKDIKIYFLRL
ncbi:MAG: hypothetical protein R6U35_00060 [Candidatus Humimicrobiaceae bacterium]